jgi:parvulin-like peptidyl-prolyl isomerase
MLGGGIGVILFIAAVLGFGYLRENVLRAQDTVAVVFGERVTAGNLVELVKPRLSRLDRAISLYRASGMTQQATQLQFQRDQLPDAALRDLVEDRVVRREATRRGVSVSPTEIDEKLREQIALQELYNQPQPTATAAATGSPAATPAGTATPVPTSTPVPTLTGERFQPAFQAYLENTGQTEVQFRQAIEDDLYSEKLRVAMGEEVPAIQEQVHAAHMTFASQQDATAALQQLQGGADFAEQARTLSQDRATRDAGGDLGWIPRRGRDPIFDEAVFALQPGQISDVLQTANGWEIVKVVERASSRPVDASTLDEMRRRQYGDWLAAAEGSPEIDRSLTPELSRWILLRAGRR